VIIDEKKEPILYSGGYAMEALVSNATFVADFCRRSTAGQELIKLLLHITDAVLDIISPCVTLATMKTHCIPMPLARTRRTLHELVFVPARDEITVDDLKKGTTRMSPLHDGSQVI